MIQSRDIGTHELHLLRNLNKDRSKITKETKEFARNKKNAIFIRYYEKVIYIFYFFKFNI